MNSAGQKAVPNGVYSNFARMRSNPSAPDDRIVVVGQDGLVANVANYLDGQPVIG